MSLCCGAVAPYTFIRVFPLNDSLLAEQRALSKQDQEPEDHVPRASLEAVQDWSAKWKAADLHHTLLSHVGALCSLIAALSL